MNSRLIATVFMVEWRRFFGEPIFYFLAILRPYLWTLLLSEGIRLASGNKSELSYLSLLSYCIVFTGITSAFSLCWERHNGFLRLWFVYGISSFNYIAGKLIFACSLTCFIIITSLPIVSLLSQPPEIQKIAASIPDIIIAIILIANIGLLVSSLIRRLDLFGLTINFILFPILFTSGSIYDFSSSRLISSIALFNPFRWAIEPIKSNLAYATVPGEYYLIIRVAILIISAICFMAAIKFLKVD